MKTPLQLTACMSVLGAAALTGCTAQPQTIAESSDTITLRRSTVVKNAMVTSPSPAGMQLGAGDLLGQQLFAMYIVRLHNQQPELFANVDTASSMP